MILFPAGRGVGFSGKREGRKGLEVGGNQAPGMGVRTAAEAAAVSCTPFQAVETDMEV